jgi:hypothetical protein
MAVLAPHELETLRRSNLMAPLSQATVAELIDDYAQMTRERAEIAAVLESLPESFGELRAALNRLHCILA